MIRQTEAACDLSKAKVEITDKNGKPVKSIPYTGAPVEFGDGYTVKVTLNGTEVGSGKYTVNYSNNLNKGKAVMIINAKSGSGYYGSKAQTFTIGKGVIPWF